jgi:signal transduction histidine kinase
MLAARAAGVFTQSRRLAYAHVAPDLTVAQVSPNFAALAADPGAPIEGRPLPDLLWEFVGAEDALRAILRGDEPAFALEQVNRELPDGAPAYLTFQVLPLDFDQPGTGLLLIVEDVTGAGRLQQRLAQDRNELRLLQTQLSRANAELQHLNRFKSFMISMVAHDLRSPLTTIEGYASMLFEAAANGQPIDREYAMSILVQTRRINQMILNLLNLDQIEQGRLALAPVACDLSELAHEAATAFEAMAVLRRLALSVEAAGEPLAIRADPERLRQALHNLIGNALKYTPEGGRVRLVTRRDGDDAIAQVIDTGPGMEQAELDNLFQPYYRTDEARKSQIVGTGLGLYIVKMLVEAHSGRVEVSSRPGQGTTFTIRLPLRRSG